MLPQQPPAPISTAARVAMFRQALSSAAQPPPHIVDMTV